MPDNQDGEKLSASMSLDRKRAKTAYEAIKAIAGNDYASEYKSYVKSLPAMVLKLGFGQAMATLLARGGQDSEAGQGGAAPQAYQTLFDHITEWLLIGDPLAIGFPSLNTGTRSTKIEAILALGQRDYIAMQGEALIYTEWLKKFANALISKSDSEP